MKKIFILIISIILFSIFVFADELTEIFTSRNNVYETNINPDVSVNYKVENGIGIIKDNGRGVNCNINLNGLNSYSISNSKGIEIFFEKNVDNVLTLNSTIPKITVTGDEDCINNLNWETVKKEYSESTTDELTQKITYTVKPQAYDYSKKVIDKNTQEITITLNPKYSDFKLGDRLVIDPTYELFNITDDKELNNVLCEGDGSCHNGMNDTDIIMDLEFSVDNDSSGITYDYSSFNNDGTSNGAVFNSTGGHDGYGAYEFDSDNLNYISLGTSITSISNINNYSISLWVKPLDYTRTQTILASTFSSSNRIGIYLSSSSLRAGSYNGSNWTSVSGSLSDNNWHNYIMVFSYDNPNFYVNLFIDNINQTGTGVSVSSTTLGTMIGAQNSLTSFFNGTIDDVMIFNRSLSSDEITALYNSQFGRFYSGDLRGNLTTNSTAVAPQSGHVNLTIHSSNQIGTDLNCSIWDGYDWKDYKNMTTDVPATFNINPIATSLNTSCIFIEDPYAFYTPILLQNITYETYNNAPTLSSVWLTSSSGNNLTTDNITLNLGTVSDADGDNVKNITDWRINNISDAVLNMPFEGYVNTSSKDVKDYSSYQNDGTNYRAVFNSTGGYNDSNGNTYGAYEFDGVDDYVQIGDSNSLDISQNVAISVWINPKTITPTQQNILQKRQSGSEYNYYVAIRNNDEIMFGIRTGSDTGIWTTNTGQISVNKWFNIVTKYTNGTCSPEIYIDGINQTFVAEFTATCTLTPNAQPIIIGKDISNTLYFNGTIDEVMIFNRSLSSDEISLLYQNQLAGHNNVLHSDATTKGDFWKANVTVNDGIQDGDNLETEELLILSEPPNLTSPSVTPSIIGNNTWVSFRIMVDSFDGTISSVWLKLKDVATNMWDWFEMTFIGDNTYEYNITISDKYNESEFFANNTDGSSNTTAGLFPKITYAPSVTNILESTDPLEIQMEIQINATIINNANLTETKIEITYPDLSAINYTLSNETSGTDEYNYTFTPIYIGFYSYKIIAVNEINFINDSETGSFNVQDTTPPSISLENPIDNETWSSSAKVYFNFNCTDYGSNILNASLIIGGNIIKTTNSVNNGGITEIYNIFNINQDYNWTVGCHDTYSNYNEATARNLSVNVINLGNVYLKPNVKKIPYILLNNSIEFTKQ